MGNLTKKIIIAASIILVLLIIVTFAITARLQRRQEKKLVDMTPVPTQTLNFQLTPTLTSSQVVELRQEVKSFTSEQSQDFFLLKDKLPEKNNDFELDYSDFLGKFYVQRKSGQADAQLENFLRANNYAELNDQYANLFVFTTEPVEVAIKKDEDLQLKKVVGETEEKLKVYEDIEKGGAGKKDKDLQLLVDLMKTLLSFDLGTATSEPRPQDVATGDVSSLETIFAEAGVKVGTPPVILKAVMQIECGWIFSLSAEKIAAYSQPGGGLQPQDPCFGKNSAGAVGPMQFLTTTWPPYSTAVNRYGGYTHPPSIWNIRDSTYAASEKLRKDSLAFSINWNHDHVRRAVICYNAGCGRLDNPPAATIEYFNKVWDAYSKTL